MTSAAMGWTLLIATVVPLTWGSRRVAIKLFPSWAEADVTLAQVVLGSAAMLSWCQLLGSVGWFHRLPVAIACCATGLGSGVLARSPRRRTIWSERAAGRPRSETLVTVGVSAFALSTWAAAAVGPFRSGILEPDSLNYHLPFAARFVQLGDLTRPHFIGPEFPIALYPANGEVTHAVGMLFFGNDVVSPFLNLFWLGCSLLAAWCIGESTGRGPLAVTLSAIVLVGPAFPGDQGGTAANDAMATFFLLASAALVLRSTGSRPAIIVAALAAGIAVGTKLTVVIAVAALTVGLAMISGRGERARLLLAWFVPLLLGGGFWYARNFVRAGSPTSFLPGSFGPLRFPRAGFAIVDAIGFSVADYAFDARIWRTVFIPGLARWFGPAWWITVAFIVLGAVLAIAAGDSARVRILGIAAAVALLGYAFTPTTALGPRGEPALFAANLVYVVPMSVLALCLLARMAPSRLATGWTIGLVIAFIGVAQFGRTSVWRSVPGRHAIAAVLIVVGIGLLVGCAAVLGRLVASSDVRRARWCRAVAIAGGFVLVLASGLAASNVSERYLAARYRSNPLARWSDGVGGARIAEAGIWDQYPLYGARLSNHVQWVGSEERYGQFHPAPSCRAWRAALRRGGYEVVVLRPYVDPWAGIDVAGRELRWTETDPAASGREVLDDGSHVFRFASWIDDPGCDRTDRLVPSGRT